MTGGFNTGVCGLCRCVCLQRYLVAVGGIALQQQWSEQLDQSLIAEDTALLEQESMLEPTIPQLSSIRGEAYPVREGGNKRDRWKTKKSFFWQITKFFTSNKKKPFLFCSNNLLWPFWNSEVNAKKNPNPKLTAYRLVKKEVGGGVTKPIGISKGHNSTWIKHKASEVPVKSIE